MILQGQGHGKYACVTGCVMRIGPLSLKQRASPVTRTRSSIQGASQGKEYLPHSHWNSLT